MKTIKEIRRRGGRVARGFSSSYPQVKNKEKEVEESELWVQENKTNLNEAQIKNIKRKIYFRKFINSKVDGKYKECIKILFNSNINLLNLKNLIIFLLPVAILKKLLWYHQD